MPEATKLHPGTGRQPEFLTTKVVPPRRGTGLIERPRLLGLIAQVETKQLTVVKAGAGFGKTSIAAAWAARLGQNGNWVAWLSLDAEDDEPTRFLFYVAQALRRARNGLGNTAIDLIMERSLIRPHTIVSTLINELAEIDDEGFLFLDDYHCIADREIHDALSFLLKHAPPQFHLVIGSRVEPALPLARLRAQNQMIEVDASALRFDLEETRQFLEHENFSTLSSSEVKNLNAKTEGWPAVLRVVVSIALQKGEDPGQYVRGLSAAFRPISAYLAEMLDALSQETVQFMLRTAILDRLSASLVQAVTGVESGHDMLVSVEARQLLVTPLDEERNWYRYHPLLRDYLCQRLEAEQLADEILLLHRRASRWYASHELWTDAVQHAIAAGDDDQAISWIENCAMELVKRGDMLTLLGWQRLFPTDLMRNQLKLRIAVAWGMALAMRFEEAMKLAGEIEQDLGSEDTPETEALQCECQTIRSVAVALKDDSQSALSLAEGCLGRATDPWTANVASNVARFGHWKAGDLKSAYATPWIPYSLDEDRRNVFSSVYRLFLHGLMDFQQLRLGAAERHYVDALRLAEQHAGSNSVAAALPASLIARIRYEQGQLDVAEAAVLDRVPIINATGTLDCVLSAYLVLTRTAVSRRHIDRAYALLEQAENLGHTRGWGRLVAAALLERLRLHLAEDRITEGGVCVDRLERLAAEYPAPTSCAWSDIHHYANLGRAHLASAQNRQPEAIAILSKLRQEAESADDHYFALRLATHLSVALLNANKPVEASKVFGEILHAGAPAGIYQAILDQGPWIGTLLLSFQDSAPRTGGDRELTAYADRLIAGWRARHGSEPAPSPTSAVAESLSSRECSILERIGKGESNKEIARALGITPETVKSHVKNIFVKLAVEKRAQAVSRAQSLGLVSTN